jgi:hypothetical protein
MFFRWLRWYLDWASPQFLSTAASVIGIGAGLNSLFGGGSGGVPSPQNYIYANPAQQAQAAQQWLQMLTAGGGLESGLSGTVSPAILGALQSSLGVSNAGVNALPGQLQPAYGDIASADQLYAKLLGGAGTDALTTLPKAGLSTWLTALDPQNALHDRIRTGLIDTSRAGQAARGIEMGGVGQGMENEVARNFEMDWSHQILGRQVEGLTALERALGTGSQIGRSDFGASSDLLGGVPGALTGGAMAPQTAGGLNADYLSAILTKLGGGYQQFGINPLFQTQNQIIPFLSGGAGAGASAFGGALDAFGARSRGQTAGTEALMTGMTDLGKNQKVSNWLSGLWGSNSPAVSGGDGSSSPTWNDAMYSN